MSADSFHALAEKQFKKKGNIYDWEDYVGCLSSIGDVLEMEPHDFKAFQSRLSQGKKSKESRPLLADVAALQFRRGMDRCFFKKSHVDGNFSEMDFLMKAP